MRSIIGIGILGTVLMTSCVMLDGSFHRKSVTSATLEVADNPSLEYRVLGDIDPSKKTIELWVPPRQSLASATVTLQYSGVSLAMDGRPSSGKETLDLRTSHQVAVTGMDDEVTTYTLVGVYQPAMLFSWDASVGTTLYARGTSTGYSQYWSYVNDYEYYYKYQGWGTHPRYWVPVARLNLDLTSYSTSNDVTTLTSVVPTFGHNAKSLRWNGTDLVSGQSTIDVTSDQTFELVTADGEVTPIPLTITWPIPTLKTFSLSMTNNPTLRRNIGATIDTSAKKVQIEVPNYVVASSLVPTFGLPVGTSSSVNGTPVISGTTPWDLSKEQSVVLTLKNQTATYQVVPIPVPASTVKEVTALSLYGSVNRAPPFLPTSTDKFSVTTAVTGSYAYKLTKSSYYYGESKISPAMVYLELTTSGISAEVGGKKLALGSVSSTNYSVNNWVDFTSPVVVTITAEDLSTQTYAYTLVLP